MGRRVLAHVIGGLTGDREAGRVGCGSSVRRLTRILVLAGCLAAAAALAVAVQAHEGAGRPRCFGAASRDAEHPCTNPRLLHMVRPSPRDAALMPNAPCTPFYRADQLIVCRFGLQHADAVETVALVGDSHATHWRAAFEVVARARRWEGLSITHTACPFTNAVKLVRRTRRSQCRRFARELIRWLGRHPAVSTVVLAELTSSKGVITRPGQGVFAAEVAGYLAAWRALPRTVRHLVVIRDTPQITAGTLGCVERAMARHLAAGPACAVPRASAVKPDPAAVAASRLRTRPIDVVRLNRFICDRARCYPVVGGALVYKDTHHLTRVFGTTLGPYLLRRLRRLMAAW
jgi:hypothetical protein